MNSLRIFSGISSCIHGFKTNQNFLLLKLVNLSSSNLLHTFIEPYSCPLKVHSFLARLTKLWPFGIFDAKFHKNGSLNNFFTLVMKIGKFYAESYGAQVFQI